jgi:hypothetical protein
MWKVTHCETNRSDRRCSSKDVTHPDAQPLIAVLVKIDGSNHSFCQTLVLSENACTSIPSIVIPTAAHPGCLANSTAPVNPPGIHCTYSGAYNNRLVTYNPPNAPDISQSRNNVYYNHNVVMNAGANSNVLVSPIRLLAWLNCGWITSHPSSLFLIDIISKTGKCSRTACLYTTKISIQNKMCNCWS